MGLLGPDNEQLSRGFEAVNGHLAQQDEIINLLRRIAGNEGPGVQTLAVSESAIRGGIEADFPTPGAIRWIIPRVPSGGVFTIKTEMVTLLPANTRRLGLSIVNSGEFPVRLFLNKGEVAGAQSGIGTEWLKAEGGAWDGRLSSLMWCGAVTALAIGGESTVDIAEV